MRKYVTAMFCLSAVLSFCGQSLADVHLGGYVETDNRLRLQGGKNFTWNENRLGLKLEGEPS
ncbi:MAG: hypothetical protein KAQ78_06640, partial [Candidatus Latescibacteria bacterium]|nr:hypothetical protein [Candidatus Latescibacterota bacterium]